ncbi:hypothetical protein D3C76_815040 [compost metagenome]
MNIQWPVVVANGGQVHQHQVSRQGLPGEHTAPVVQPGTGFDPGALEITQFIPQASLGHQAQRQRGIVGGGVDLPEPADQPQVGGAAGEH